MNDLDRVPVWITKVARARAVAVSARLGIEDNPVFVEKGCPPVHVGSRSNDQPDVIERAFSWRQAGRAGV